MINLSSYHPGAERVNSVTKAPPEVGLTTSVPEVGGGLILISMLAEVSSRG